MTLLEKLRKQIQACHRDDWGVFNDDDIDACLELLDQFESNIQQSIQIMGLYFCFILWIIILNSCLLIFNQSSIALC